MKLSASDYIAGLALLVSGASLGISTWTARRDRGKLRVTAYYISPNESNPNPYIRVVVVNVGRRPVVLYLTGGVDAKGRRSGTLIDHDKGGRRLEENERYEYTVTRDDIFDFLPDGEEAFYVALCIEDSLGTRFMVPNSRDHIKRLNG